MPGEREQSAGGTLSFRGMAMGANGQGIRPDGHTFMEMETLMVPQGAVPLAGKQILSNRQIFCLGQEALAEEVRSGTDTPYRARAS